MKKKPTEKSPRQKRATHTGGRIGLKKKVAGRDGKPRKGESQNQRTAGAKRHRMEQRGNLESKGNEKMLKKKVQPPGPYQGETSLKIVKKRAKTQRALTASNDPEKKRQRGGPWTNRTTHGGSQA